MSPIKITSLVAVALVCLAAGRATAADSNDCATCKFFAKTFQHKPEFLSKFVEFLYKPPFCSNETDCEQARKFVQNAEVLFMLLTPEENCKLVGICESDQGSFKGLVSRALESAKQSGSFMGRASGRNIATETKQSDPHLGCDICAEIVEGFQEDLKFTAQILQMLCGLVPPDEQNQCQRLADKIVDKLKADTPEQFCAGVGFC